MEACSWHSGFGSSKGSEATLSHGRYYRTTHMVRHLLDVIHSDVFGRTFTLGLKVEATTL